MNIIFQKNTAPCQKYFLNQLAKVQEKGIQRVNEASPFHSLGCKAKKPQSQYYLQKSVSEVHKFMMIAVNDQNSIKKSAITLRLFTRLTKHAFVWTLSILCFIEQAEVNGRVIRNQFYFSPFIAFRHSLINFPSLPPGQKLWQKSQLFNHH